MVQQKHFMNNLNIIKENYSLIEDFSIIEDILQRNVTYNEMLNLLTKEIKKTYKGSAIDVYAFATLKNEIHKKLKL